MNNPDLVIWSDQKHGFNCYVFGVIYYAESIEELKEKIAAAHPHHTFKFHLSSELRQLTFLNT